MKHLLGLLQFNSFDVSITILLFQEIKLAFVFRHKYNYFTILIFKIVIYKKLTLYPRFLLILVKINIMTLNSTMESFSVFCTLKNTKKPFPKYDVTCFRTYSILYLNFLICFQCVFCIPDCFILSCKL